MLVYRIEHAGTRRGPYNPGLLEGPERDAYDQLRVFYRFSGSEYAHPTPSSDGITDDEWSFPETMFFGFETPRDLARWFGKGFVAEAAEAGFVAAIYSVPAADVLVGGHQVAFPRDEAELVRECRSFEELAAAFGYSLLTDYIPEVPA